MRYANLKDGAIEFATRKRQEEALWPWILLH